MKIYLFLSNRLLHFLLPKEILGSFSFDENEEEESKLINIESQEGFWYIYSTVDSKVYQNNVEVGRLVLETNKFYVLRRKNVNYLIYVSSVEDDIIGTYTYNDSFNINIGKANNCNIVFDYSMLGDVCANISLSNGNLVVERKDNFVYVNDLIMSGDTQNIKFGDQINIYFFKIIILPNILIIIKNNKIDLSNLSIAGIKEYKIQNEEPINTEINDEELYQKNEYYFKSPRLRRFIKTKNIKFSKPPISNEGNDLPAILTIGPMLTMGIMSAVNLSQTLTSIISGGKTIKTEWPRLVTSIAMLISMLLWPIITKWYNKRLKNRKRKKLEKKYGNYLDERRLELDEEVKYQSDVLRENLISTNDCLNIITKGGYNFWDRRSDQSDFLQVRLGIGTEKLDVDIDYSEEDFTVDEDDLKKQADKVVEDYKYIYNVPLKYSFYDNKITAIIGNSNKCHIFMNNLLLQLLTFYTYEDIKIVVFTNDSNKHYWEYLKYTNHNFTDSKDLRFFSTNVIDARNVSDYLNFVANQRLNIRKTDDKPITPHYIMIIDDYSMIKSFDFIKLITENEEDIGFSLVFVEDRLSDLPSRCNNFISIGQNTKCEVIMNSSEEQEHLEFVEEILYNIDYMKIANKLANIPIEFESGMSSLPDAVTFLEMEKVGKVEQLNILNRWNTNDSTVNLNAEVGVDSSGNLIYLDLHEKSHGPHGLIAGTTGSGKSEFIITYVLSMCMNFSPDIVSFILIDYKGGGLALAFENRTTGVVLPHLAGTITNLDKAEMDRTLVSIDSEVKRRQKVFNEAREALGESTIDIYKYQRFYKEGKLTEPVTHLFIICDEFAELKSQQPEFMDNLISVARIGRSLGVHLILATQKPSGVVNDQIWSNSRFKICLKVQSESDSKEMLKKPDAAYIKQAGRFILQVGYDEYYTQGQSGWTGAKYYPADIIVKEVDKSINFINDSGMFIKSIKASTGKKAEATGDQFSAVMNSIIEIANKTGKKAMKLWLDNIESIILVDNIKEKYKIEVEPYKVEAILGEYDAPEIQFQDVLKYNFLNDGNTIIYGNDGSENEMLLDALIYSTCKYHTSDEINFYGIDYGSESLRKYEKLPHFGGIAYADEEDEYTNLIKLIREEIKLRKKLFADYGGEYKNYIKNNKLPLFVVIFNNYDAIYESHQVLYDIMPQITRDSERYGIIFIITANTAASVRNQIIANCHNIYAFKLKDVGDYLSIFNSRTKRFPRNIHGRGFTQHETLHEFQTASIIENSDEIQEYISNFTKEQLKMNQSYAKRVPMLPEFIRFDDIKSKISDLYNVPIAFSKASIEIVKHDFLSNIGTMITSTHIDNLERFVKSLLVVFKAMSKLEMFVIDPLNKLKIENFKNYYNDNMNDITSKLDEYIVNLKNNKSDKNGIIIIYNFDKYILELNDKKKFEDFLKTLKEYGKFGLVIVDDVAKIKNYSSEIWFKIAFNLNNGIWIGNGIFNQTLFRIFTITKEMQKEIDNDMGFMVSDGAGTLCKFLDFFSTEEEQ